MNTKKPRILVVMTAFGARHFHDIAKEGVKSLLATGTAADVVVLSDRADPMPGARVIQVAEEFTAPPQALFYQTAVRHHLSLEGYDMVMRCDTDVVWMKPPEALLPFCEYGVMGVEVGVAPVHELTLRVQNFSPHQRTYIGQEALRAAEAKHFRAFNVGTTLVPGYMAAWFYEQYEAAWEELALDRWENRDEAVFNYMHVTGRVHVSFLPRFLFPLPRLKDNNHPELSRELPEGCVAVHLVGIGTTLKVLKRNLAELMAEFNSTTTLEEKKAWYRKLHELL